MKPIPVVFHIGPLQLHTYGLGLALTFYFAVRYLERRLRSHDMPTGWVRSTAVWIIVAAVVGARIMHVVANLHAYTSDPIQVLEVWHGGLSSFGGLFLGVPTGFLLARRRAPEIPQGILADLVAPVLLAAWGVGRLLGPQLMVRGGGHPTHQWFGLYYAGQVGKRLPVPLFQAVLAFVSLYLVFKVERWVTARGGPVGVVLGVTVGLWGTSRFFEEHLWLTYPGHFGAVLVQAAGVAFALAGFGWAAWRLAHSHRPEPAAGASPPDGAPEAATAPVAGGGVGGDAVGGAPHPG